jgi:hypothetical protein
MMVLPLKQLIVLLLILAAAITIYGLRQKA